MNNVDSYRIGATELVQWAMDQVKIEGLQSIDQFAEAIKNHLTNTERNEKILDSLPQSIAFQDQSIRDSGDCSILDSQTKSRNFKGTTLDSRERERGETTPTKNPPSGRGGGNGSANGVRCPS